MIFRYTILYVDDVPSSLDFYERAFGLKRGFMHEGGDYGELITGETKLAFSSRDSVPGTGVTLLFGLGSAAVTGRRFSPGPSV